MKKLSNDSVLLIAVLLFICNTAYAGWNATTQIPDNDLQDIFFISNDANTGYAVGANTAVFKTTNAGSTWHFQTIDIPGYSADFNAVWFIDQYVGFIGGDNGKLIRTTNAGSTWSEVTTNIGNNNINDIFFGSTSRGVIVCDNGIVAYTSDGGTTWNEFSGLVSDNIHSVYMYTNMSGFAVGDNGTILETHSGGSVWTKTVLSLDIVDYYGITIADGSQVVICGEAGTIIKSTNQGNTWTEVTQNITSENLHGITFNKTSNTLFAVGDNGSVIKSNDIASTWFSNTINSNSNLKSVTFVSNQIGYAVGSEGSIAKTTDAGDGITYSIIISEPNDATVWIRNSVQTITWTSTNVNTFRLYYSTDGGYNWEFIATVNDTNAYDWTLPDLISEECKIKVENYNDQSYYALSSGLFSISSPTISVISPNGAERWNPDEVKQIRWNTDSSVSNIKIEYTHDGDNWITIVDGYNAQLGSYDWLVPDIPSARYMIRVTSSDNLYDYDVSDDYFAVLGIILTSFNDGANYLYGSTHEITWSSLLVNNLRILFSTDNGNNWEIVENNYPAEYGKYTWQLPITPANQCKIRLIDAENSIYQDESILAFKISGISLTSPIGGEVWMVGTNKTITWQSTEIENVKIEYTPDEGSTWITIISSTSASNSSYTWKVPNTTGYRCRVRISDVNDETINDISDEFFTISGSGVFVIEPNSGGTYNVNSNLTINWASGSAAKINIYGSTNNGNNWFLIQDSIEVNANPFNWMIPNTITPSTECLIKIEDSDNSDIYDISDETFRIRNNSTYYKTPESWNFTSETGSNSIVILPSNINPTINGNPLEVGDAVGIFYNKNGNLYCAGFSSWNNANMSITVWGDNPQTADKDGMNNNEQYIIKVWNAQTGEEIFVDVEYSSGFDYFTEDGISIISKFDNHKDLMIVLKEGWSMISSNIVPKDTDIEIVLDEVIENMEFMKDEEANVFYPKESLFSLNTWKIELGYQIFMNQSDTLRISGVKAVPSNHPKFLQSKRWYIVSYLPQAAMSADIALQSLDTNLLMIKNSEGEIYYPDFGINLIGEMIPSKGYKIITCYDDTLRYPATSESVPKVHKTKDYFQSDNNYKYVNFEKPESGINAVIGIQSDEFKDGDEIAAYTLNGVLCGVSKVNNGKAGIVIWGDDIKTHRKDGAESLERLDFKLIDENGTKDIILNNIVNVLSGKEISNVIFFEDAIFSADAKIGTVNSVNELSKQIRIHPQPASNFVTIEADFNITKVALMSIKGEVIQLKKFNGFIYAVDIETQNIASGTYILMIHSENSSISKKIIINK